MKRLVNGVEVEIEQSDDVEVTRLPDRLAIRTEDGAHSALALRQGDATLVSYRGQTYRIERAGRGSVGLRSQHSGEIRAPMPGLIVDVFVAVGQSVKLGDKLLVLEAMKTQQALVAPFDGVVSEVRTVTGGQVSEGELLVTIAPLQ